VSVGKQDRQVGRDVPIFPVKSGQPLPLKPRSSLASLTLLLVADGYPTYPRCKLHIPIKHRSARRDSTRRMVSMPVVTRASLRKFLRHHHGSLPDDPPRSKSWLLVHRRRRSLERVGAIFRLWSSINHTHRPSGHFEPRSSIPILSLHVDLLADDYGRPRRPRQGAAVSRGSFPNSANSRRSRRIGSSETPVSTAKVCGETSPSLPSSSRMYWCALPLGEFGLLPLWFHAVHLALIRLGYGT